MPQVFISHSTKDEGIAAKIRDGLEAAGIPCWIAPRDIEPGSEWTQAIMHGLQTCPLFLLLFTRSANQSKHVRREVSAAFDLGHAVLPIRLEEISPVAELGYYLNNVQWLNATRPPIESHVPALVQRVRSLLRSAPEVGANPTSTAVSPTERRVETASADAKKGSWVPAVVSTIALAAFVALGLWFWVRSNPAAEQPEPDAKSVAVLPFDNLSSEPDNAYFADGVQEEILSDLAKLAQLRVTSRTSVMQYRGDAKKDLRKIAAALGVRNILEGTVQREGNRVRVNAELIDARTDRTLWADSYDRDLTDIFAIQSEVAQSVAAKLKAQLTGEEEQRVEQKPTENLVAYDLYLQGKALIYRGQLAQSDATAQSQIREGIVRLEQAVAADPKFALAYCAIARAYSILNSNWSGNLADRTAADQAIAIAQRLAPDLPEVSLTHAEILYRGYRDFVRAEAELKKAERGLPNSADALELRAYMARRQGRFEESAGDFAKALKLNPTSLELIQQFALLQAGLRHWLEAKELYDRAVELAPSDPQQAVQRADFLLIWTGDLEPMRQVLQALLPGTEAYRDYLGERLNLACFDRDWAQARSLLESFGPGEIGSYGFSLTPVPSRLWLLVITRFAGSKDSVESFRSSRDELFSKYEQSGNNPRLLGLLGLTDVFLGDLERGQHEAEQAVSQLPVTKDPVDGPDLLLNLAAVYAWSGKTDRALEQLETINRLTFAASAFGYGELLIDPIWDPLRQDSRFTQLLNELKPK